MIIDTSQGSVEVVGDIKEFKTSIDPKNLEFITTLLSSNLYSDPEQSFIREIVSNAWDSHVEAGTTDTPVIVRFNRCGGGEGSITIRDYGVGLSPERFQEVYCNIGSSTKRDSNDFIGGFGIGKYSALACSNTVYITSYYEGKAYYYVMVKSGNSITTNLLMEKPTNERNGVEVTIKSISSFTPYDKALQCIVFFPNVYIDGAFNADIINSAKLKRFNNFAATSIFVSSKLLLGNVLYPVQKYHLNYETRNFIEKIESTGIVIKFDVGEINITPNRENIIYSSDTIKKIEDRVMAAKAELDALVDAKVTKDYDDIIEYYNAVSKTVYYDPVSDSIKTYGAYYRIEPAKMLSTSITYKGVDLRSDIQCLSNILSMQLPNFKGVVSDDKIYSKKMPWNVRDTNQLKTPKLLVLNAGARLIASAKSYIRENYDEYGIMTDISESEFYEWVKEKLGSLSIGKTANLDLILTGIYQSMMKKAVRLDLDNDATFLKYKADLAANRPTDDKDLREAILYVWDSKGYKEKKTFKRFSHAVDFIKGLKKGIILTNMDVDDYLFSTIANLKGFAFIKARKDIVADLKELKLKCIVDINWLTNKDPMLSIVKTLVKQFPNTIPISLVKEINENLDRSLQEEFMRLCRIDAKFRDNNSYKSIATRDHIPYDPYTEYLCMMLKNYIAKHEKAKELSSTIGCYNSILTTAVVIKTKAYKVSGETYNRFKNNKLLNVLCRK